ncbi:hypothetical protein J8F10_29470 [Gemmata sp. G18]|uniref:Tetratricopeptide repeat protein n=1 Tax=Gemmata palustris TaxID=2822762 RepID=A0ABS5C080_9BACT|nr:hypothetical protein [Gemmata palustris]MBP3959393.1 hypothetical protein [Gemmata palustris]
MSDSLPPDDLDHLLAPLPTTTDAALRSALLRATQRRISRTRWVRRAGKVAAIAAVFVVGVGVGVLRTPPEREKVVVTREVETIVAAIPVVVPVMISATEPPPVPPPTLTAARLELDAEQADGAAAATLYRRAGDTYLATEQDYANAARCYRLFLTRGGDTALSPESDDSWLLASLKNAAFKEKIHATTDG